MIIFLAVAVVVAAAAAVVVVVNITCCRDVRASINQGIN